MPGSWVSIENCAVAVGLARHVELFHGAFAADQAEGRRVFQWCVLRHGQPGRGHRELAEAALPARGDVAQHAALHGNVGGGHRPRIGRGLDQHGARNGAGLAHLLVGVGDRAGAARALDRAEGHVVVELGVGRRVLGAHLRPVGVHLLGHQRGEAGHRALAEFDVLHQHGHRAVGAHAHEGVRREVRPRWALGAAACAARLVGARYTPTSRPVVPWSRARRERPVAFVSTASVVVSGAVLVSVLIDVTPAARAPRHGWPPGCARRSRIGRCCRASPGRCRRSVGFFTSEQRRRAQNSSTVQSTNERTLALRCRFGGYTT
jgi:hypothetical protein